MESKIATAIRLPSRTLMNQAEILKTQIESDIYGKDPDEAAVRACVDWVVGGLMYLRSVDVPRDVLETIVEVGFEMGDIKIEELING